MLDQLFGNKSISRILFFLLINGRCYAGKLARHFRSPLTPFQQGFAKLEEMGIIESSLEGKIRYFQFNRSCPYLLELESLLRKTYTLLTAPEKKEYYDTEAGEKKLPKIKSQKDHKQIVMHLWERLPTIHTLTFSASSHSGQNTRWNGVGTGDVRIQQVNDNRIIFYENGSWKAHEGGEFAFTNVFRWTLDRFKNLITLEHLRFGEQKPVFLFDLSKMDDNTLASVSSHVCNDDSYLGQVKYSDKAITFNWRIIGPKKNEEIHYIYKPF